MEFEDFYNNAQANQSWAFREMMRDGRRTWTPTRKPLTVTATTTTSPLDDELRADCSSAPIVATMHSAVGYDGLRHSYKKIDSTTNTLTVAFNASETADGVSTLVLSQQYAQAALISNGTTWDLETPQFGSFTSTAISGLTSGRIACVTTGGLFKDYSSLTYDGATLAFTGTSSFVCGTTIPISMLAAMPPVQVHGLNAATSRIGLVRWGNVAGGPTFQFGKSRGTSIGAHAALSSGDAMTGIDALGSDGANFQISARLQMLADANATTSTVPGRLEFSTANSSGVLTLAQTIDSAQNAFYVGTVSALTTTPIPAGGTAGAGFKLFSTSNFGIFGGSGLPTLSAAQGSLYMRSDGTTTTSRAYVNTGTTNWTYLTAGA